MASTKTHFSTQQRIEVQIAGPHYAFLFHLFFQYFAQNFDAKKPSTFSYRTSFFRGRTPLRGRLRSKTLVTPNCYLFNATLRKKMQNKGPKKKLPNFTSNRFIPTNFDAGSSNLASERLETAGNPIFHQFFSEFLPYFECLGNRTPNIIQSRRSKGEDVAFI